VHGPIDVKLVCQLHVRSGERSTKLFFGGPKNSEREWLQIFRNNLKQLIVLITPYKEPGRRFML